MKFYSDSFIILGLLSGCIHELLLWYVSFEWSEHLSACKQSLLLLGECHSVILPLNFLVKLITSKINYIKQFIRYEKGSNWTISIIEWKKVLRDEQSTSP